MEIALVDVTFEQAQRILDHHLDGPAPIQSFKQLNGSGFSAFTPTVTYEVTLAEPAGTGYLLKVQPAPASLNAQYRPNSLVAEHAFLQQLAASTSVPHPTPHALDTSLTLLPHPYLLLSKPPGVPLSSARRILTERQALALDLRLGAYLKELHNVENDWFGLPAQANDGLYSWQEAFTGLLEGLLGEAHAHGVDLPYESLRAYFSRAIGSFLFDDCEVPSLVSFAGDGDTVILDIDPENPPQGDDVRISSFLSFSHALWGDPLLETMFLDPSAALIEGYGRPLILFPRQKTKRLWYTMLLALVVTVPALGAGTPADDEKVNWAKDTLKKCTEQLKDAPCY